MDGYTPRGLVDTLIQPFHRRTGRQSISAAPKFYLFDVGVAGQLCGRRLTEPAGSEFVRAFEHYVLQEIVAARGYRERDYPIQFWRTKTGLEVDFVLNRGELAVEVKGRVRRGDLRPMRAFREEFRPLRAIIVTAERDRRRVDGIDVIPCQDFLLELHAGEIV